MPLFAAPKSRKLRLFLLFLLLTVMRSGKVENALESFAPTAAHLIETSAARRVGCFGEGNSRGDPKRLLDMDEKDRSVRGVGGGWLSVRK